MPPRKQKRRTRRWTTPPHKSPSPPPEPLSPSSTLSPPSPPSPPPPPSTACLEVFENIDIVDEICAHLPREDLWAALQVSKTFYPASARRLYSHIELTSSLKVVKLLNEALPARTTRRQARKPARPFACLEYTTSITVGNLHRITYQHRKQDVELPSNWKQSLARVLPNVRFVKIRPGPGYATCCWPDCSCAEDLWRLADALNASEIIITAKGISGQEDYAVPDLVGTSVKTLTLCVSTGARRCYSLMLVIISDHRQFFSPFENVRILYNGDQIPIDHTKIIFQTQPREPDSHVINLRIPWRKGIVNFFAGLIGENTNQWTLYMLGNHSRPDPWRNPGFSCEEYERDKNPDELVAEAVAKARGASGPLPSLTIPDSQAIHRRGGSSTVRVGRADKGRS